MQTLYDLLNVPMNASPYQVWQGYRHQLTRVHPDRCYHDNESVAYNANRELDQARVRLLHQAYNVLSDSQKRREYDAYLTHQSRIRSAAYHQTRLGSDANGFTGVVKTTMDGVLTNSHGAASTEGPTAVSRQLRVRAGARGGANHPRCAYPMTRALDTQVSCGESAAPAGVLSTKDSETLTPSGAPSSGTWVYTASVTMQRQPDGTVLVRTIKTNPSNMFCFCTTDGGAAPISEVSTAAGAAHPQQQQQQQRNSSTDTASSTDSDVPMPRRIRVVEEHLVMRS